MLAEFTRTINALDGSDARGGRGSSARPPGGAAPPRAAPRHPAPAAGPAAAPEHPGRGDNRLHEPGRHEV